MKESIFKIGFNEHPDSSINESVLELKEIHEQTGCYFEGYSFNDESGIAWYDSSGVNLGYFKSIVSKIKLKHIEIIYINNVYIEDERVMDTRIDGRIMQGRALPLIKSLPYI